MILIKRKKIVMVGISIGLLYVFGSYLFSSQSSSKNYEYQSFPGNPRYKPSVDKDVVEYEDPSRTQMEKKSKKKSAQTWLPPDDGYVDKTIPIKQKRKKKSKKTRKNNAIDINKFKQNQDLRNSEVFVGKIDKNDEGRATPKSKKRRVAKQTFYGENGVPHKIDLSSLNASMQEKYHSLNKIFGYNALASMQISVQRKLQDVRSNKCISKEYKIDQLPTATVIIAFFNEAWSTLLRTVHSVISRSPMSLLIEILLVDDGSTMDHLKQPLDDYIKFIHPVKLIRTGRRIGVVRARQLGVDSSTGDVLVFLDSHSEVTTGWLEPMLNRIHEDETSVVTSVMDIIDDDTLAYKDFKYDSINIGAFTWGLQFVWIGVPLRVKNNLSSETDPISTPTMSGGLFAVSRKFFNKLGGFDIEMDMWGAENFEMSFKTWMCGGKLETLPCSHVGHLFRKGAVYTFSHSSNEKKNFQRVAEVWMDEYKDLYYQKSRSKVGDVGDISSRVKLRKTLECHSFDWYIQNVYPEMFVSSKALVSGEIRNIEKAIGDGTTFPACIDSVSSSSKALSIWPCHGQGGNQFWMLSATGEIRNDEECFDYAGVNVVLYPCHGHQGNQEWFFKASPGQIVHKQTQLCLSLSEDHKKLTVEKCNHQIKTQIWHWGPHQRDQVTLFVPKNVEKANQEQVDPDEDNEYYEDEEEFFKTTRTPKAAATAKTSNKEDYNYYEEEEEEEENI